MSKHKKKSLKVPSIKTKSMSLRIVIVVNKTSSEKKNVHIGSATFQLGFNKKNWFPK